MIVPLSTLQELDAKTRDRTQVFIMRTTLIDFIDQAKRNRIEKLLAITWKNNKCPLETMYSAENKWNQANYVM
jgi:cephalosporin-C deacetylase-like acetyl esterase